MPPFRRASSLLLALLAAFTLAALACTSDDPQPTASPTPSPSPTSEATQTPISSPTASPTIGPPIPLSTLAVPEDCRLFNEGYWERPLNAGVPVALQLTPAPCARTTLDGVAATSTGLLVEWISLGSEAVPTAVILTPDSETGRWQATVTFPEPGRWVAHSRVGIGDRFDVFAADLQLATPSSNLPLPAAPKTVAVLNGDATEVLRTFSAEFGGLGFLRNPDRVVFVDTFQGAHWLVTGNIETGRVEPLFQVGPFATAVSAPDGRAIAVQWRQPSGRIQLRIATASGDVTAIDDGSINPISISWAPDSSTLITRGNSLWILAPDGTVRRRHSLDEGERPSPIWSPDSTYALFWTAGKLTRLDMTSLQEQLLVSALPTYVSEIQFSPDLQRVAIRSTDGHATQISVLTLDEFTTSELDLVLLADYLVATFDPVPDAYVTFAGMRWSPDGTRIALTGPTPPADTATFGGTAIWIIDLAAAQARRVAKAPDFYSSQSSRRVWSADSSTLFAIRFNCTDCEPSSSAVDVIDAEAGRIITTFEASSLLGLTTLGDAALLTTPQGVLRTDGRAHQLLYDAFRGGITFGPAAVTLADPSGPALIALQLGVGHGQQLFAADPDGANLADLGVLGFNQTPYALIDPRTVVIRHEGRWTRYHLDSGLHEPYPVSAAALEKFEFTLSPSARLAVARDSEGFAILDATNPAAEPLIARRAYPGAVVARPVWSPHEGRIAFADTRTIGVVDVATAEEQIFELAARLWAITWTPDAALLVATPDALWLLDPASGAISSFVDAPDPGGFTQGTALAYSPDGQTLVAGTQFGVFQLRQDGTWLQLSSLGLPVVGGSLHWSPDSTALAIGAESGYTPEGIVVIPLNGSDPYRLVAPGPVTLLAWLPDGRIAWLTTTGGV